jgi:hypothetical protein
MKTIAIISIAFIIGCARVPEAPPPPIITPTPKGVCISVYHHILDTQIQEAEADEYPELGAPPDQTELAKVELLQEFHDNGTEKAFFIFCRDELSLERAICMMRATSTGQITLCSKGRNKRR